MLNRYELEIYIYLFIGPYKAVYEIGYDKDSDKNKIKILNTYTR